MKQTTSCRTHVSRHRAPRPTLPVPTFGAVLFNLYRHMFWVLGFVLIFGGSAICASACLAALWLGPGLALKGVVLFLAFFAAGFCCFSDWLQR